MPVLRHGAARRGPKSHREERPRHKGSIWPSFQTALWFGMLRTKDGELADSSLSAVVAGGATTATVRVWIAKPFTTYT
jgi:hypothetical protein